MRFLTSDDGTNFADVMIQKPDLVLWLGVLLSFVIVVILWARSRPSVVVQQPQGHCPGCSCQPKPGKRLRKALKGFAVVGLAMAASGCGTSTGLQAHPRIALFGFKPITVMFRTGVLPEFLKCASVLWDFGDGSKSFRDSDGECEERRSISHVYRQPGRFDVTARFKPSVGNEVLMHAATELVDVNRSTGLER
jgi:hypothetical protein